MNCRHCKRIRLCVGRGLCRSCYSQPAIRALFDRLPYVRRHQPSISGDRSTMAELDRIEAEQRPTMPPERECNLHSPGVYIPESVNRGRGIRSTPRRRAF